MREMNLHWQVQSLKRWRKSEYKFRNYAIIPVGCIRFVHIDPKIEQFREIFLSLYLPVSMHVGVHVVHSPRWSRHKSSLARRPRALWFILLSYFFLYRLSMTIQFWRYPETLILRSTAVSCLVLCAGICVLSGCIAFQGHAWKRSCVDRLWSLQRVARYWRWGVDRALAALW